ncbi:hypothetical protein FA13DRAFT_1805113 [Coprinellus micaceus]|uniref:F-box domain-containing protein n=1 Tax=Coprinellus micaceus TaxID=71717 RepID=A0A4Y7S3P8_COPMI|nr:hypothetical protein FA13DRAFT_1805113 [Coprinellus micaceus]
MIDLPEGFLEDRSPRLRTLHLSNCRVPDWDFLPLGSILTSLRLEASEGFDYTCPTWNAFLVALQRMVVLVKLSLRQWLPKDDTTSCPWSSASPLPLKAMQSVSLTDSDQPIKRFFEVVRIPEASALEIELPDTQDACFLRGYGHFLGSVAKADT